MLQKLDVHTQNLLDLADFIDDLDPSRFSMRCWGSYEEPRCICGWYQHIHGHAEKDHWLNAAEGLGLSEVVATRLFAPGKMDNKEAAAALRHLAHNPEAR